MGQEEVECCEKRIKVKMKVGQGRAEQDLARDGRGSNSESGEL